MTGGERLLSCRRAVAGMNIRKFIVRIPILSLLFAGCTQEKPATVESLHFPVVVFFSNANTALFTGANDLKMMAVQLVINSNSPPTLVDSDLAVYHLNKLSSIHGGFWLIAHPSGLTEVTFDLAASRKSGLDAARAAFIAQLEQETWWDDLPQRREKLAKSTTLKEMFDLVKSEE
jgi:hypothetical protein